MKQEDIGRNSGEIRDFCSDWFHISLEQVTAFAGVTYDLDPDHIDPVSAKDGPFGVPTAQGFLTLALLPHLLRSAGNAIPDHTHHINYGIDKVRWIEPIPTGKRIRADFHQLERVDKKDGSYLIKYKVTVELEGSNNPVMVAEWLLMFV